MKPEARIKIFAHIGLFLLLALIFYLALVLPAQKNRSKERMESDKALADQRSTERKLAMLREQMDILKPVPPDALTSEEMPMFLRDLSVRCRDTGASVDSIKQINRDGSTTKAVGLVYPQKFEIGLTGDFPSLFRMLVKLEDYHKLMTIDALRFDVERRTGERMKAVAQATVYVLDLGRRTMTRPGPARSVP